jgi:hypothetical protein
MDVVSGEHGAEAFGRFTGDEDAFGKHAMARVVGRWI